ncbi:GIY-YIG nuclease family protein [Ruminococcus sp. FMB-CY1]|uniref:GIY-YIG nuclease family protein n=1 Tax=unclassified Ruminococcus TaxID=2608920 RepID=UPI00208E9E36|nr:MULTISPECIES: GIY-YIG nuclease family protein [unclassified Ruminococcus]USP68908.1 GIY-YIG nuclease family protein [Ruminococcus sp. FMBCY1]WBX57789.1 GIY-YIG nuclease family protein [Ruminococcus sp. FMB-CY1]
MGFFDIFKVSQYKSEIETLKKQNDELKQKLSELCFDDYDTSQRIIQQLKQEIEKSKEEALNLENQRALLKNKLNDETESAKEKLNDLKIKTDERILSLNVEIEKTEKKLKTAKNKLDRTKELYKSIDYSISNFFEYSPDLAELKLYKSEFDELEELSPSVILKLHYMDVKSLRKAFKDNDKQIEKVLSQYRSRYTTKANQAIYDLMVIALRAELQNILYNLKYEKLDNAIEQVKNTSQKYLNIAAQGNQNIAGTLTKFIGEIEYLFINAVKIEYNYYVKKEQAKQEQLAIKEQIRQEAEERKALEQEKKKIENEELKYNNEIEKLKEQLKASADEESKALNAKILELQAKLADVTIKKDNIVQLQNGKAGNVYIISNLGSFGENVFKVGMTRRIDPQDRVNELGNASVPFKFDVHSFIFSEDAVGLESKLHSILNDKRVNKVNMRKEFFYTTVDELEELVNKIEPTAEFNKTMLAEEFRQSQSSNENYTNDYTIDEEDE